jgi:hypothetical protein
MAGTPRGRRPKDPAGIHASSWSTQTYDEENPPRIPPVETTATSYLDISLPASSDSFPERGDEDSVRSQASVLRVIQSNHRAVDSLLGIMPRELTRGLRLDSSMSDRLDSPCSSPEQWDSFSFLHVLRTYIAGQTFAILENSTYHWMDSLVDAIALGMACQFPYREQ